jgi:hypothetical protein
VLPPSPFSLAAAARPLCAAARRPSALSFLSLPLLVVAVQRRNGHLVRHPTPRRGAAAHGRGTPPGAVAWDERPSPWRGGAGVTAPAGGDADPLPQRGGVEQRGGATGASAPRPDGAVSPLLLLSLARRRRNRASVCSYRRSLLARFGASMPGSVCSPTGSSLVDLAGAGIEHRSVLVVVLCWIDLGPPKSAPGPPWLDPFVPHRIWPGGVLSQRPASSLLLSHPSLSSPLLSI